MITRRQGLFTAATVAGSLLTPISHGVYAATLDAGPLSDQERALHALDRLGFGPRPADSQAIKAQGAAVWLKGFLAEQLHGGPANLPSELSDRLAAEDTASLNQGQLYERFRRAQELNREAKKKNLDKSDRGEDNARKELVRPVILQASEQRILRALASPAQLEEVLVDFWFNHFNVFAGKGPVSVWVGSYEREAIRPNVLGSFRTMLGATAKHPAMLFYLDNAQSVAAGWQPRRGRFGQLAPKNAKKSDGLNENYAREVMELHTLGVDGGYTQQDVTQLARMLTGWTFDPRANGQWDGRSMFRFIDERHDQGRKVWLGRRVEPAGQKEGEMALDVLAAHPSTAKHIGFKLAQAFVADEPPPALVKRLADRFTATQGNLREVMVALIESDEFWSRENFRAKFKTPYRYVLSSLRAIQPESGLPREVQPLLGALAQAGMPLYGALTPDGYKNTAAAWQNPEALAQRVQLAQNISNRIDHRPGLAEREPDMLQATLGPLLSDATRQTVYNEPPEMRTALLLGSPDFMHF